MSAETRDIINILNYLHFNTSPFRAALSNIISEQDLQVLTTRPCNNPGLIAILSYFTNTPFWFERGESIEVMIHGDNDPLYYSSIGD